MEEERTRQVVNFKKTLWKKLKIIKAFYSLKSYESVIEYLIQQSINEDFFKRFDKDESDK